MRGDVMCKDTSVLLPIQVQRYPGTLPFRHRRWLLRERISREFQYNLQGNTTAYLGDDDFHVVDISVDGEVRVNAYAGHDCYDRGRNTSTVWPSFSLEGPYTFSHTKNQFFVIGCDAYGYIMGNEGVNYTGGCLTYCESLESFRGVPYGKCSGLGCCEISIPRGLKSFTTMVGSFYNYTVSSNFNRCGYTFLVEESTYKFNDTRIFLKFILFG